MVPSRNPITTLRRIPGGGQDQRQDRKQQDLGAVALGGLQPAARHFRMRRWGFGAHGSYPDQDASPPGRHCGGRPNEFLNT
jgi:hypothetical protein